MIFRSLPHALKGDEAGEDAEGSAGAEQDGSAGAVHPAEPLALEGEFPRDKHHEEEQRKANDGGEGIGIVVGFEELRVGPGSEEADWHAEDIPMAGDPVSGHENGHTHPPGKIEDVSDRAHE
jgi:hypothetical protein